MLSGGLMEAGSKALQGFCLRCTCFILHCSSKVPAMSMPYPKTAGAEKTFPVIATSACQTPPPHWALGWKTQTVSSETSVVILSIQTEESPWLEYRRVESRWEGRDVCQQEQKGRERYAKRGYTDRCKDKRNGCTVQERFINAGVFLFRTFHWIWYSFCLSLSPLCSEHTWNCTIKTIVLPLLVFNLHNGFHSLR